MTRIGTLAFSRRLLRITLSALYGKDIVRRMTFSTEEATSNKVLDGLGLRHACIGETFVLTETLHMQGMAGLSPFSR